MRNHAGSSDCSANRADQLMLGRQQDERRAVDRVDPGGEHFDRRGRVVLQRKLHAGAFRPPDPVLLHREHFFRPVLQPFDAVQQIVGVGRDLEEPLLEILLQYLRAAAPACTVDDLLVGEHGLAARTPVDGRAPAIRQAALEHPDEQPLVPVVVVGQTGGQLALPRVADAQALQLPLHVRDVAERGFLWMDAALDCGVLRRQAESVPPERMQHIEALQPLHPRDDVADDVVADVPHVGVARRVGKHLEAVELGLRRIFGDFKGAALGPALLPLSIDVLRVYSRTRSACDEGR